MNILAIDIGTYSVKFLIASIERKSVAIKDYDEIMIDRVKSQLSTNIEEDIPYEIIKQYLSETPFEGKIIFQLPNNIITTRYLNLPIPNKKKAELMLPFQLDEDLPYAISSTHYISVFLKKENSTDAIVNISQLTKFEEFFNTLESRQIIPHLLTSEMLLFQNYLESKALDKKHKISEEPFCILDIGHSSTKAYFVQEGQIVSNHISPIGGKILNDIISETYQISLDDAVTYKHENCFFLTENQYDEVDKDQQDFAKLMKQTFSPLINDIHKWELAFRTKNAAPIKTIYLTGGCSKINNITNFLSQSVSLRVEHLDIFEESKEFVEDDSFKHTFTLSFLMSRSQLSKIPLTNFLKGQFSSSLKEAFPIHSMVFIAWRVILVTIIVGIALLIEKHFLIKEKKSINRQITTMLKNPSLNIKRKDRYLIKKKPDRLLQILKKKNRSIKQEVSNMMSSLTKSAISPLAQLEKKLPNNIESILTSFTNESGIITAQFLVKEDVHLDMLHKHLESLKLKNAQVDIQQQAKTVVLEYQED